MGPIAGVRRQQVVVGGDTTWFEGPPNSQEKDNLDVRQSSDCPR